MRTRSSLLATLAALAVVACSDAEAEDEVFADDEAAVTGTIAAKANLVVTCEFTYLQKTAAKGNPVAGLAKGRELTAIKGGAPTNGFYHVTANSNEKAGFVLASCVKKDAAKKTTPKPAPYPNPLKPDASAPNAVPTPNATEPAAEEAPAPAAAAPAAPAAAEATAPSDDDGDKPPAKKLVRGPATDEGGCALTATGSTSGGGGWLLLGVVLPLVGVRRARRRRESGFGQEGRNGGSERAWRRGG